MFSSHPFCHFGRQLRKLCTKQDSINISKECQMEGIISLLDISYEDARWMEMDGNGCIKIRIGIVIRWRVGGGYGFMD